MENPKVNRALGCIMGVLVGDAAGALLEFRPRYNHDDIKDAINMKGGGSLNVGPGQVTDDGELTLSLMHSLTGKTRYPINEVAKAYNTWINSYPFDIGSTCRKAFAIQSSSSPEVVDYSDHLLYNAAKYNMLSEANGALMRCSPIAVWAHNQSPEVITQYAKLDAMLSHPNQVCLECNAIYVLALASIINGKSNKMVFSMIEEYVETKVNSDTVKKWFFEERHIDGNAKQNIGHVKHAFCMAINFLEKPIEYEKGIESVLKLGGDTDTNAAICGGILGAINGYDGIPDYMKQPVLSYEYNQNDLIGYYRPENYRPKGVVNWVNDIFSN